MTNGKQTKYGCCRNISDVQHHTIYSETGKNNDKAHRLFLRPAKEAMLNGDYAMLRYATQNCELETPVRPLFHLFYRLRF